MRRCLLFFVLLFLLPPPPPGAAAQEGSRGDYVVLLHGIARSSAAMGEMAEDFTRRGFVVLNLDYPSTRHEIPDLADKIHPAISAFAQDRTRKVHFVGHSMGGLVIRAYIARHRPENLGRVVLLGTPSGGSEVADFLKENGLYKSFYGPAGQQLTTDQDYDLLLGKVDYEVGVIAGDRTIDPVSSALIPGRDDGKVSVARTHLAGEKDHITLHVNHALMSSSHAAIVEAAHFLTYGFFKRDGLKRTTAE